MRKPKFFNRVEKFNGSLSQLEDKKREWEKLYKNRWSHDKVVRTTHGVNCTGSCSWNVYVKEGIITWEHQATDYPSCGPDFPEFEPRGCPRGASFSWYEYSPLRIKYPYMRRKLWDLWKAAKAEYSDPIQAWASIVENPEKAMLYKRARGKGGLIRVTWEDAKSLISAMLIYTIKKYGPDRIAGFSPIPAMSMISYAAGSRFISLLGGELLSFYDWYADLPPASPQVWGEQTDVPESSDWYNSQYIMMWGSNVPLTRTPDAHFMVEARYKGTKVVAVSPDYAENVKFADNWLAPHPGTDAALAQGMTYVILQAFYQEQSVPSFNNYVKQYTDLPFLVTLEKGETANYTSGRFLRISDITEEETVNAEWKTCLLDKNSGKIVVPNGTVGQRWEDGKDWNLTLEDEIGNKIDPQLSLMEENHQQVEIDFPYFSENGNKVLTRHVPAMEVTDKEGNTQLVTTVFDLMMSQYGIKRYAEDTLAADGYDDAESPYTPAWQEKITGVKQSLVIQIAKEFAQNALDTGGKSMVIMGAGINQWFNGDMTYRSIFNLLLLTGCEGVSGGGWAHYVGQEKLRPQEGWKTIAFAKDWTDGARQQNGTSFFYFAGNQWKYDELDNEALKSPTKKTAHAYKHPADYNQMAIRLGWLPSYPQFDRNNLDFVKQYGTTDEQEIKEKVVEELKNGTLAFAAEAPDKNENQPKAMFVWRSNLFSSSGKGQEYFMKHMLGAENGLLAQPNEQFKPVDMEWSDESVEGKVDLLIDLDFRMVATAMHSDIVLPAATWYEKEDLSSTDMHPFIHPFNPAVSPLWESKTDWQIFRDLAKSFSELAKVHLPDTEYDLHAAPLSHDSKDELAQPFGKIKDWKKKEIEPIPGKTLPNLKLIKRDYGDVYDKFIALGPNLSTGKVGGEGYSFSVSEQYEELKRMHQTYTTDGINNGCPILFDEKQVADSILTLSSTSNGKVAAKAWKDAESKTGVPLSDVSAGQEQMKMTFADITAQPKEAIPSPIFSSVKKDGERYSPFTLNIERLVPFRTLTGRQQFYIDHEVFDEYGENLAVYKPTLPPHVMGPKDQPIESGENDLVLRYLTPHGKWNIHTMYQDNLQMLTLFRGGPNVWISIDDAKKLDIADNDWLEVYNRNGVVTARAVVSHRMPTGTMYMYHAQDMHIQVPLSNLTGNRGGSHNAPTQIHVKPTQMVGGYAQLSYGFNYYGPIGNQRDLYVAVRKLKKVNWNED